MFKVREPFMLYSVNVGFFIRWCFAPVSGVSGSMFAGFSFNSLLQSILLADVTYTEVSKAKLSVKLFEKRSKYSETTALEVSRMFGEIWSFKICNK